MTGLKETPRKTYADGRDQFCFGICSFYFLRHGATADCLSGILQGQRDTELADAGRKAVALVAERLAGDDIRSIHASPLRRTRQSALIVSQKIWCAGYRPFRDRRAILG